jgi:lysophospholipase L1-like esterase
MRPNLTDHRMTGVREPHNFRVTTNSDGFRTSVDKVAEPGRMRIALMGDSTVFGWGVENDEGIAEVAHSVLQDAGLSSIEVVNFGQPGYSTGMVSWLFNEAVAAYKPDLTIVFISMHDFNRTLMSDVERIHGAATVKATVRSVLVQHVTLYEVLRRQIYPLASHAQLLPHQSSNEARVERVSDAERTVILDGMRAQAAEWGGDVAVGFLPFYADLQRGSTSAQSHSGAASLHIRRRPGMDSLEAWSAAADRPVFDLRACCAGGASERTFPFDHGHLNALGNREVGQALAEAISQHLGLQAHIDDGG